MDRGITYTVDFLTGDRTLRAIEVDATGCQGVTGVPGRDNVRADSGLWSALASAAGVTGEDAAFRGTLP